MKSDLPSRITCLITTGEATDDTVESSTKMILNACISAARCGVSMVQIREKKLSSRNLLRVAERTVKAVSDHGTIVMINGRPDIAAASGAAGVQLTDLSISVASTLRSFADRLLIGRSTHSLAEVITARDAGADFAIYGPVFATPGKGEPKGLSNLSIVCAEAGGFPVVAVGGIDAENFVSVFDAGARGIASIRSMHGRYLLETLKRTL